MSAYFGQIVQAVSRSPRRPGVVIRGASIGSPQIGMTVVYRSAFTATVGRVVGIEGAPRGAEGVGHGLAIDGLDVSGHELRGGFLADASVRAIVLGARLAPSLPDYEGTCALVLPHGEERALVRLHGGALALLALGHAEASWQALEALRLGKQLVGRADLIGLGPHWPARVLSSYSRRGGLTTVFVLAPAGAAHSGDRVLVGSGFAGEEGEVLSVADSGLTYLEVARHDHPSWLELDIAGRAAA